MNIVFASNFLNQHQLPLCTELSAKSDFLFIASMPTPKEQLSLGYDDMNETSGFVLKAYENGKAFDKGQELIKKADVVIAGSCAFPFGMLKERLDNDKLTYWFSERLFKRSPLMRFYPPTVKRVISQCTKYRENRNYYLLAAGAFVAKDYSYFGAFNGKSFKWGYFPANRDVSAEELLNKKEENERLSLMWAGRMIPWKNPQQALLAVKILQRKNIPCELHFIGEGQQLESIKKQAEKNFGKNNKVIFHGAQPFRRVRELMDSADIFLLTSGRREGWGAVLNESMDSACAVLAERTIGAGRYLIEHGKNGMLYAGQRKFKEYLTALATDRAGRIALGEAAVKQVRRLWSAENAASNFIKVSEKILGGEEKDIYCEQGPMSKA